VPPTHRGLLDRIDALVALVADRHGLALLPDGRLAAAEARVVVRATGLAPPGGSGVRASTVTQREAVELLRAVAEGVGLLRVRGDRLEATSLRNAWSRIDETLRAGLVYAAWCQQVTLTGLTPSSRGRGRSLGRGWCHPGRQGPGGFPPAVQPLVEAGEAAIRQCLAADLGERCRSDLACSDRVSVMSAALTGSRGR
jgi:hypothetical protein